MAMNSFAVPVGTTDTDVVVCPPTLEGAAVLHIGNVSGSATSYTIKIYRQSLGAAVVVASGVAIAANSGVKFPAPISLEAGDKIQMVAPVANAIVATGTFTNSAATPAAVGFTPRGAWSNLANYVANDIVSFTDGASYVARRANTNKSPATNPDDWMVSALRGLPGAPGSGSGDMLAANNLSDLTNPATARTNLSVLSQAQTEALLLGLQNRGRVKAATTANITIATALNAGDVIDGVTLVNGDLVLVKNQSAAAENGIYVVAATPVRSAPFDTYDEHPGAVIVVTQGSTQADTMWYCTSNEGGTLGTTALDFSRIRVELQLPVAVAQGGTGATDAATARQNLGVGEVICIACSDETTNLTTGTARVTFRMPFAMTLTGVRASLTTASSSGNPAIDVNENGTSIFSTVLTIDANELTSTTAATPAVLSDTSLADDAQITIDIDAAGTGARGLKVYLIGRRA